MRRKNTKGAAYKAMRTFFQSSGSIAQIPEISRAFRQAPWRAQTQAITTFAVLAVVMAALGGMYLTEASKAATAGRDVQSLQLQKAQLTLEVDRLEAQIAEAKSLPRLEARARELSYVPARPEQMEFLVVKGYPGLSRPAVTPAEAVPAYDETLGAWLARWLSAVFQPGGEQ
jgi:hypothetical protein